MNEPLSREQVKQHIDNLSLGLTYPELDALHALDDADAALRDLLLQREEDIERLIKEAKDNTHKPTVTYWMNMTTQMQQEAKKRFDDWFAVAAERDDLRAQLAAMTAERDKVRELAVHAEFDHDHYELVKQQLAEAQARMQRQREVLTSLVTVVGQMKVPQTIADAALQLLIVGPVLKRAEDFIATEAQR